MKRVEFSTIKKLERLGKGSFAKVFKVESSDFGIVAAKYVDLLDNKIDHESVKKEADIMIALRHLNITQLYGICETEKYFIILMKFEENGDLFNYIHSFQDYEAQFIWPERLKMCIGICRGLKALHDRNIIHRDLKSSNILLDRENTPKISDFGLSKVIDEYSVKSSLNNAFGDLLWRAPEIVNGRYSKKSDIYSLGMVFWEIGTGKKPFEGFKQLDNRSTIIPKIEFTENFHLVFKELVEKCLDKDPEQRPDIITILNKVEEIVLPLLYYARIGDINELIRHINQGDDVNMKNNENETPLHVSSSNGHLQIVQFLVEHGANINSINKSQETPLSLSSANGHLPIVEYLISHGADFKDGINKESYLHWSARNGYLNIVENLINKGEDIYQKNQNGEIPVELAKIHKQGLVIQFLERIHRQSEKAFEASKKGDIQTIFDLNKDGFSINTRFNGRLLIHLSSENGHLSVVEYLVNQKVDINSKDNNNWTPLHYAAKNGHLSVVEYLVNQKADINSKEDNNWTPLHYAAKNGHLSVVEYLLHQGADFRDRINGQSYLHWAAESGHLSVVEYLVNQKADINAKNNYVEFL